MSKYAVYVCGQSDCPHDPNFVHANIFGPVCVPKDMPMSGRRAGLSRTNTQHEVDVPELGHPMLQWDGGCDAAGVTIPARIAEHQRPKRGRPRKIVLDIKP